jgi:BlaI family penicillinase repressor
MRDGCPGFVRLFVVPAKTNRRHLFRLYVPTKLFLSATLRLTTCVMSATKHNTMKFNIRNRKTPTPLEQVIMDYVWAHPHCTAEMCREGLARRRPLKDSTIRTILRNLEEKGYVTHDVDGRTFVYRAVHTKRNVAVQAAQQLIDRFCGGSVEDLLVGLVDNQLLEPEQLQRLAEKIASRREKKA